MLLLSSIFLEEGEEESILNSNLFARELLCFSLLADPPGTLSDGPFLACLKNLSPSDLVDLTDLLSLDSTLPVSLQSVTPKALCPEGLSLLLALF